MENISAHRLFEQKAAMSLYRLSLPPSVGKQELLRGQLIAEILNKEHLNKRLVTPHYCICTIVILGKKILGRRKP